MWEYIVSVELIFIGGWGLGSSHTAGPILCSLALAMWGFWRTAIVHKALQVSNRLLQQRMDECAQCDKDCEGDE